MQGEVYNSLDASGVSGLVIDNLSVTWFTDSIDPRNSDDESYRKYTQDKIAKGCYLGERTLRFEYKDQVSDWFEWMHIDPDTLRDYVNAAGCSMKHLGSDGKRYLVSIVK